MSTRPLSLSLDLDNLWSYMKTHGDAGWQDFPGYLDVVVPRFLEMLDTWSMRMTVFVVGQDAALDGNRGALRSIADAGHEIGNHSFHHEPWLHLYSRAEITSEIARAEEAIEAATGQRPKGFRGPGYSLSETVLEVLQARGYDYDCSTFPTMIGPLARAYYFFRAGLDREQRARRNALFGSLSDGLRPNRPYEWRLDRGRLLEIPVTTMPLVRVPVHFSYLHWLAGRSEGLASAYFTTGLGACDLGRVQPSLLLHPLDFLGADDVAQLAFFPAMNQSSAVKMRRMRRYLSQIAARYEVEPMAAQALRLSRSPLPARQPDFRAAPGAAPRSAHEGIGRK